MSTDARWGCSVNHVGRRVPVLDPIPVRFPAGRRVIFADNGYATVTHILCGGVTMAFDNGGSGFYGADWFREHPTAMRLVSRLVREGRQAE